jgi:hypothetical protein
MDEKEILYDIFNRLSLKTKNHGEWFHRNRHNHFKKLRERNQETHYTHEKYLECLMIEEFYYIKEKIKLVLAMKNEC